MEIQHKRRGNLQPHSQHHKPLKGKLIAPTTNHPSLKIKQLTSNIEHTLRNQHPKFTNVLIDIIFPSSFNHIMALPPPLSFLVCQ